jgi:transcriptional regulator with XRE-family HTH domain
VTAKQLKARRKKMKLSQAELAALLHMDPHHIYMLESGRREITHVLTLAIEHLSCKSKERRK